MTTDIRPCHELVYGMKDVGLGELCHVTCHVITGVCLVASIERPKTLIDTTIKLKTLNLQ